MIDDIIKEIKKTYRKELIIETALFIGFLAILIITIVVLWLGDFIVI